MESRKRKIRLATLTLLRKNVPPLYSRVCDTRWFSFAAGRQARPSWWENLHNPLASSAVLHATRECANYSRKPYFPRIVAAVGLLPGTDCAICTFLTGVSLQCPDPSRCLVGERRPLSVRSVDPSPQRVLSEQGWIEKILYFLHALVRIEMDSRAGATRKKESCKSDFQIGRKKLEGSWSFVNSETHIFSTTIVYNIWTLYDLAPYMVMHKKTKNNEYTINNISTTILNL